MVIMFYSLRLGHGHGLQIGIVISQELATAYVHLEIYYSVNLPHCSAVVYRIISTEYYNGTKAIRTRDSEQSTQLLFCYIITLST